MSIVVAARPLTTRPLRFGAAISLAVTGGLLLLTSRATPVESIPLIVVAAAAVIAVTVHRPAIGCALLVVGAALTAGLGRSTVIPALRTSEALTLLVGAGTLLREIGRRQRYSLFDVVVLIYALGAVLVPFGYLWVTGTSASLDAWRTIVAPLQFLLIYLIFSRARLDGVEVAEILRLAMLTSVLIATVAMAQVADVPGVRGFIETFYPGSGEAASICSSGPCRATSLLEHYSGLGAFAVLHYTLALVLCAYAPAAFSGRWLTLVMALNAVAAFISGTQAAMLGLGLATIVCVVHARRLPRQLVLMMVPLAAGLVFFWNQIQLRIEQQFSGPGGVFQAGTPESLDVRARYWTEIFVPLLKEHLWFGTGSVIPAEVPQRLVNFVDNQYLGLGFRAGLVGELLLALMLIGVVVAGWRYRRSDQALERAVGGSVAAFAVVLAVIGTTAEYLTFAGVAQAFWMLVGIMGGWRITTQAVPENLIVLGSSEPKKRRRRLA